MASRTLKVELIGDASSLNRALGQAQSRTSRFGAVAKSALIGGAAAGLYALGKAAKIGWDEYNNQAKVAAQTNAVIKSTGGIANVTAKEVEDLGTALMLKSGIDDEVVKSGENVLLTFRNVRNEAGKQNDIFTQATKAALDLSVAMGLDMNSAALTLGKALNDPATGLSRLIRVGVTFNTQQQETIKNLAETGHRMEAQKMILAELTKEFGGSAAAAGKTFGGQLSILRERLNNFLGDLTERAIPYLQRFMKWVGPRLSQAMQQTRAIMAAWRQQIDAVTTELHRHQAEVERITRVLRVLQTAVGVVIKIQLFWARVIGTIWVAEIRAALTAVHALTVAVSAVGRASRAAGNAVMGAFRGIAAVVMEVVRAVQTLIGWINRIPSSIHLPSIPGGGLLSHIPGLQHGGPVSRGRPYVVGERGPELFVPRASGRIVPNGAMAGGGSVQVIVLGGDRDAINWLRGLDSRQARRSGRGVL